MLLSLPSFERQTWTAFAQGNRRKQHHPKGIEGPALYFATLSPSGRAPSVISRTWRARLTPWIRLISPSYCVAWWIISLVSLSPALLLFESFCYAPTAMSRQHGFRALATRIAQLASMGDMVSSNYTALLGSGSFAPLAAATARFAANMPIRSRRKKPSGGHHNSQRLRRPCAQRAPQGRHWPTTCQPTRHLPRTAASAPEVGSGQGPT